MMPRRAAPRQRQQRFGGDCRRDGGVFGCGAMVVVLPSRSKPSGAAAHRVTIRLDLAGGARIGPGKIALLEEISRSGSISAAGRVLKMSYRRAWELIEDLNRNLGVPVVSTASGGSGGGGARLTPAGLTLVSEYRAIERASVAAADPHLASLAGAFSGTRDSGA